MRYFPPSLPLARDCSSSYFPEAWGFFPHIYTMLRSTITTGSYILEKYSRSYPSYVSAQTQSSTALQPEWQHFTNPVITLTLDVKKSLDNNFESVRLRILWNMDMSQEGTQREITMVRTKMPACMRRSTRRASSGRSRSLDIF